MWVQPGSMHHVDVGAPFPLHMGLQISFTGCLVLRDDKSKRNLSMPLHLARLLVMLFLRLFLRRRGT